MDRCFWALLVLFAVGGLGAEPVHWKALLVTGYATDGSTTIDNWENSREAFQSLLIDRGVDPAQMRVLSARSSLVGTSVHGVTVARTSLREIHDALVALAPGPGEGLIVFLTSHGQKGAGFSLEHDGSGPATVLTPEVLARDLADVAGNRPVVALISACFAGQFADPRGVAGPTRVVLTAARRDRSSFGCGAGVTMPEWDDSLIRVWRTLDSEFSWQALSEGVANDVASKETDLPSGRHSLPQASIGLAVAYPGF